MEVNKHGSRKTHITCISSETILHIQSEKNDSVNVVHMLSRDVV